jgi:hypothetical protein
MKRMTLHFRLVTMLAVVVAAITATAAAVRRTPALQASRVTLVRAPGGAIQPQLAVDTAGQTHALYYKGDEARGDLFYARLDKAGAWTPPLQVNSQRGAAIATGTMRGGHLALGRNGRVHVAWQGSENAPRRPGSKAAPVMYTRLNDAGTRFERERNVVQLAVDLDAGSVAADASGHVYVTWHAGIAGTKGEGDRRVWVARSDDDGATFATETPANEIATGACGCCGIGAMTDRSGALFLLYRSAAETVHRDAYLLTSRDHGQTFKNQKLQEWNVGACPMSTFSLSQTTGGMLAAWETAGQVSWLRVDDSTGKLSSPLTPSGPANNRKHPAIAANASGEVLLAWTEGTGWNKGGGLAWQLFDRNGAPIGDQGRAPGVPTWSLVAVAARADGGFIIAY